MFRVGIIGTENSHALAFAKLVNLPDPATGKLRYPDIKIMGLYGPDPDSPQQIVKEAGAEFVASSPEEFIGKVDAMMITSRKGSVHAAYALPFIRAGMPLFIDKPFTSDVAEAQTLIDEAKTSGSKLCGGSGCKLAYDIEILRNQARALAAAGELVSGCMNFHADPASEYDGFYFYSPHLTEMMLEVFGDSVRSIQAFEKNGSRMAVWRYDDYDVAAHYANGAGESTAVLYAKKRNIVRQIDISMIYQRELEAFVQMLRTGEMPHPYESLIKPVQIIAAIEESVRTGKEVGL